MHECNVTLEIIECLLRHFPGAAAWDADPERHEFHPVYDIDNMPYPEDSDDEEEEEKDTFVYPLHLVCQNASCSKEVIQLLLEKSPSALLHHSCLVRPGIDLSTLHFGRCNRGQPLDYYLSRETNIDVETVKMLIEADDNVLASTNPPIVHVLLCNRHVKSPVLYDIFQAFAEINPSLLRVADASARRSPLHVACLRPNIDSRIFQLLLDYWPDSISH